MLLKLHYLVPSGRRKNVMKFYIHTVKLGWRSVQFMVLGDLVEIWQEFSTAGIRATIGNVLIWCLGSLSCWKKDKYVHVLHL